MSLAPLLPLGMLGTEVLIHRRNTVHFDDIVDERHRTDAIKIGSDLFLGEYSCLEHLDSAQELVHIAITAVIVQHVEL